jgi:hypothetical protein
MSTLRKQETKKITTEGDEKMTNLSNNFTPTDVNKKDFDDTGIQICVHCKGTGVNPKYEKVNKIINAIFDYTYEKIHTSKRRKSVAPYCMYCFGEGKKDRIQNNNKKDKREIVAEMQYRKNISQSYNDIEIFLIYVANCETIYDCDKEIAMHYDIVDDSWKEYNGSYNVPEAKLNLVNYMREFRTDGYFDITVNSAEDYFYKKNVFKRWTVLETTENLDICWCCQRHYTELKRFRRPADLLDSDFTGPYVLDNNRPLCQLDEKAVKAFEEDYKLNKNDIEATKKWLIKKYGNERAEEIINAPEAECYTVKSWECRDCGPMSDDEYFEKLNKNELSLYLDKEYIEKKKKNIEKKNKLFLNLNNENFDKKTFSFKDIKF